MRFRFDAGTIVLEGSDQLARDRKLPGMRWDGRVGAFRAPAYEWPRIRDAVVEATGHVLEGQGSGLNGRRIARANGKTGEQIDPAILSPQVAPADLEEAAWRTLEVFLSHAVLPSPEERSTFEPPAEPELGRG